VTTIAHRFAGGALALFLFTAGSVALAAPASAAAPSTSARTGLHTDVQDFTFSSFVADYYLGRDSAGQSTLKTVEKLTAQFPSSDQNKGIVRKIPDNYLGSSLHTKLVSVSDTNGVTKPFSVNDDGETTTIETGTDDFVHGAVTYTLTYTQTDVVGQFANTDDQEFYWDTNGTAWDQPFTKATARVHVTANLALALSGHNACYQGAQGSKDKCDIAVPDSSTLSPAPTLSPSADGTSLFPPATVITATATNLSAGENMTVAIGFVNGTFTGAPHADSTPPSEDVALPKDTVWGEVVGGILLLLGLASIPFALVRRFAFGQRNAKGRGTIIPQYDVPTGINVMEAAALVGLDNRAVSAQIVSFAVRGNLRILAYPITESGADYTLELTNTTGLDAEETQLLQAFFPDLKPGATFEVVAAAVETGDITAVRSAVRGSTIQKGWRVQPSVRAGVFTALTVLGLFILDIVVAAIAQGASALADLAIPITFVAMIVAFACIYRGLVLTASGADQRDYLLGMKLYLTVAEEDRMRILQSPTGAERINYNDKREIVKLYEKLLPFAVVFNVEDEWSKVLAIHYTDSTVTPNWYVGNGAFNSALFIGSLSSLSNAVTTSTTPIATSSGGGSSFGGSFGGGFSGGGGGGGGGGGR
jgi:uncharacterized membrane protein YgcG